MKFREAIKLDAEQLALLHADSWRNTYRGLFSNDFLDNEVIENRLSVWWERLNNPSNNQFVLVAEDSEKINGFVCVYGNNSTQYGSLVDNLHIWKSHIRNGIGTVLMKKAGVWLQSKYPDVGVYLWVMESNNPARAFYEKLGARNVGVIDKPNPVGGGNAKNCRYVWSRPTLLAGNG